MLSGDSTLYTYAPSAAGKDGASFGNSTFGGSVSTPPTSSGGGVSGPEMMSGGGVSGPEIIRGGGVSGPEIISGGGVSPVGKSKIGDSFPGIWGSVSPPGKRRGPDSPPGRRRGSVSTNHTEASEK